jgi:hypothetical protein
LNEEGNGRREGQGGIRSGNRPIAGPVEIIGELECEMSGTADAYHVLKPSPGELEDAAREFGGGRQFLKMLSRFLWVPSAE